MALYEPFPRVYKPKSGIGQVRSRIGCFPKQDLRDPEHAATSFFGAQSLRVPKFGRKSCLGPSRRSSVTRQCLWAIRNRALGHVLLRAVFLQGDLGGRRHEAE